MNKKQETKLVYGLIMAVMGGLILFFNMQGAFAETNYKHVGIQFSNSCNSLIEIEDYETCSSYDYLDTLFIETIPKDSFKTLIDIAQNTEKTKYQINNILLNHQYECVTRDYCNIFNLKGGNIYPDFEGNVLYWFDPDLKFSPNLDILIRIHTNLKPANIDKSLEPIQNNDTSRTLTLEVDSLFINSSCRIADYTIKDNIDMEIPFIIWYMIDNCKDSKLLGGLNEPYTDDLSKHYFDPTTSPNWQYEQELKELKLKYKEYRIGLD